MTDLKNVRDLAPGEPSLLSSVPKAFPYKSLENVIKRAAVISVKLEDTTDGAAMLGMNGKPVTDPFQVVFGAVGCFLRKHSRHHSAFYTLLDVNRLLLSLEHR